jgi:hypothetical protein
VSDSLSPNSNPNSNLDSNSNLNSLLLINNGIISTALNSNSSDTLIDSYPGYTQSTSSIPMSVTNSINNELNPSITNNTHVDHTPTNSISSIQKSVSNIIKSYNHLDSELPTLLYTTKRRSNSIRRTRSIRTQSLDFIDTSNNLSNNISMPTPISLSNSNDQVNLITNDNNNSCNNNTNQINYDDDDNNNNNNFDYIDNSSAFSFEKNDKVILLPKDPIDKSIPPCTTEQLTPIVPVDLVDLNMINSSYFDVNNFEKPNLLHSNFSSTTSSTMNSFMDNSIRGTSSSLNSSPIKLSSMLKNEDFSSVQEFVQSDVNPIFTKANQIDHLDKDLDVKKNDLLADQMALNILQNISEENVDELSKLKEEISMKF